MTLYEDFAHHPTAIRVTLETLRRRHPGAKLVAVIEPRSNTMRLGSNNHLLAGAVAAADEIHFYMPDKMPWNPADLVGGAARVHAGAPGLIDTLTPDRDLSRSGNTVIVCVSNGSFDQIPASLQARLAALEV